MGAVGHRQRIVVGLLALALIVALAGLTVAWRAERHETSLRQAGEAASRAARAVAVELTTYDYRTVEDDHARVTAAGTARFRRYFASVGAKSAAVVRQLQVTARGTVVAAAPQVGDSNHVRVLLFVDQVVRAKGTRGSQTEEPRISIQMVREGDRWLVDTVDLENSVR